MCKASFEHGVAQRITHHASSQLVDPFSVSTSSLGACPIIFETIRTYFPLAMDYNQPPANSSADTTSKSIPPIALCNFRTSDGWKISTPYKIHPECGVTVRQPSNRASRTLVRVPTPQCPSYGRYVCTSESYIRPFKRRQIFPIQSSHPHPPNQPDKKNHLHIFPAHGIAHGISGMHVLYVNCTGIYPCAVPYLRVQIHPHCCVLA